MKLDPFDLLEQKKCSECGTTFWGNNESRCYPCTKKKNDKEREDRKLRKTYATKSKPCDSCGEIFEAKYYRKGVWTKLCEKCRVGLKLIKYSKKKYEGS